MLAKELPKKIDSPKVKVGEIDTRAPFQSVRDAVHLFGAKARPHSAYWQKRVLLLPLPLPREETKKELDKLKERLKNAETTKAHALLELHHSKTTVEELRKAIKQLTHKHAISPQLDAAKQELHQLRQDIHSSLESKSVALSRATEAENAAKLSMERAGEISIEISVVQLSIQQLKFAGIQARQEETKIYTVYKQLHKAKLEESSKKLRSLKKEFDSELIITSNLETQLTSTVTEIDTLRKTIERVKTITLELDDAKDSLQKVAEEEVSLRNSLESLKVELENVKKEHFTLKEKEAELRALNQIKVLTIISISKEELESLSSKVKESETLAVMKVAAAMAQVEAVKASESEALQIMEANLKEIEAMKAATWEAMKRAEMDETAKRAVERELRRLYQLDQKKAAEAAAQILTETEIVMMTSSPPIYRIYSKKARKYEKTKTFAAKKARLPNLNGIFSKRKNQMEGSSPYLPDV